jgi:hypothetical protein
MREEATNRNRIIALLLAASAVVAAFYVYPLIPGVSGPPNLALKSAVFYRPVMARIYSFNQWTLPYETPTMVGNAIAKMNASFVFGLIRLEGGATVTPQMLTDYNTVKSIILTAGHPKFDIWLRADKYSDAGTTGATVVAGMQAVLATGMQLDAFSFDGMDALSPQAMNAVVSYAHQNGKLVGGGCTFTCQGSGVDYILTSSSDLPNGFSDTAPYNNVYLNSTRLNGLASVGVPVILGIHGGATPVDASGNTFNKVFTTVFTDTQRANYITSLANQQGGSVFAFAYPVFYPVQVVGPPSINWDSPNDDSMLPMMISLAATYNVHP